MNNLLSFSSTMSTIWSFVLAVLILLATITIHEFGHYLVGKIFKFKINEFAIGMGPAIFKKKLKNGEIFSIRIFPLGGFCAFEGEDADENTIKVDNEKANLLNNNSTIDDKANEKTETQLNEENQKQAVLTLPTENTGESPKKVTLSPNAFNNKKPWQRILVLIAGATFNFIIAILIVTLNFAIFGHFTIQTYEMKDANNISLTEGEFVGRDMALQDGDKIIAVNGQYLYLTTDLSSALKGKKKNDLVNVVVERNGEKINTDIMLNSDIGNASMTDLNPVFEALGVASVPKVKTKDSSSPFKDGCYMLRFDDNEDYNNATRIYNTEGFINYISKKFSGETIGVWTNVNGEKKKVELVLNENWSKVDKTVPEYVLNYFAIESISLNYQMSSTEVKLNFGECLYRPTVYAFKTVGSTFKALGQLFTGNLSITSVSGPVSTISFTASYVSYGFNYFLEIAAFIGISVAIFNLLPIPALDGARAVFVAIEWARKKPVNRKIEGMIHFVGLIALFAFAIIVDVIKLFI